MSKILTELTKELLLDGTIVQFIPTTGNHSTRVRFLNALTSYIRRHDIDINVQRVKGKVEMLVTIYCDFQDLVSIFPEKSAESHSHEIQFWISGSSSITGTVPVWIINYSKNNGFHIPKWGIGKSRKML